MAASVAIRVHGVSKHFGALKALDEINLEIPQGEFFGLLGPNGAGKTTLISTLAGLTRPTAGKISVMGYDVQTDYRQARRQLGVVPQELVFDPFFTVRETLKIQSGYFGVKHNDAWIEEILENLDLTSKANANTRTLSGGMKRRVLIAQALVHRPPVIVLDEPTAGVDVELRQTLWRFIRRLNSDGHTIVLTTHYLEEAESLCTRVAMLKAGQIVLLDSMDNVLRQVSSHTLRVKLDGAPPAGLALTGESSGAWYAMPFRQFDEIEPLLARLREAGCVVREVEIGKPALEDVFIRVMQSGDVAVSA
ncbi:MAG: ABC transporter ATP-binding protein [Rhodocyclaceae bacterium]|nr:ABC transporter ATP-binding protein [Rhodocyclaceae bacterium]MBL0075453.1 ABC transporter ATP-binding protein [Rhodocyclaceae bacterium]MBP6110222.1 ABC transporter ATP-binding protein [Rhodocyclaceae bacterium]MBP6279447.1 ABC transporter ATP-binding protein [Rhodocyclaceae bacterium]